MLYEDSKCVEDNLPISTSITCKPTRKFIFKIAEELLKKYDSLSNGTKINILFKPTEQIEELSSVKESKPEATELKATELVVKKGGLREKKRRTIRKQK